MTALPAVLDEDPQAEIAALAARWRRAGGPVIAILNRVGGQAEQAMSALPPAMRDKIDATIRAALERALSLAVEGRRAPDLGPQAAPAAAALAGALGGAGGLPTALAELPVTVTLILSAVCRAAEAEGFDPAEPGVRMEILRTLAQGGPAARDDGLDTAFLGARLALSGGAVQKLLATVAPVLSALLTRALAAKAVPVLGAATGAAINAAYLSYWREAARVRFALLRLTARHGPDHIAARFAEAMKDVPIRHMGAGRR
jgi:hypothetical protein